MFNNTLNLRRLRQFLEVARVGHFGRAATRLGIGQPDLSKSMSILESETGARLLDRNSKGITLTDDGRRLHSYASSVIAQTDRFALSASGVGTSPGRSENNVIIGISWSLAPIVTALLLRFANEHWPNLDLRIVEDSDAGVFDAVKQRQVDFAFIFDPPNAPHILSFAVAELPLVVVTPAKWAAVFTSQMFSLKNFLSSPIALPTVESSHRRILMKAAGQHRLDVKPVIETDSVATIKSLIEHGAASTISVRRLYLREEQLGHVVVFDLNRSALSTMVTLCMSSSSDLRLDTGFIRSLTECIRTAF